MQFCSCVETNAIVIYSHDNSTHQVNSQGPSVLPHLIFLQNHIEAIRTETMTTRNKSRTESESEVCLTDFKTEKEPKVVQHYWKNNSTSADNSTDT